MEIDRTSCSDRECFIQAVSHILEATVATELFDLFGQIAVLPYEESENSGFLFLCPPIVASDLLSVRLESPFDLRQVGGVRKMLQITDENLHLICAGRVVHGFSNARDIHDSGLLVQFRKDAVWELKRNQGAPLVVNAAEYRPAAQVLNERLFSEHIQAVFGPLGADEVQRLWKLILAATRQSRGTNILISAAAAIEAERLGYQGTRVTPTLLTESLMERITGIDGTVIIDPHGVCHAIGMILDGPVSKRGDRARGGRYNSAVMYVDRCKFPSLIVVISQDGMIDLVCDSSGRTMG